MNSTEKIKQMRETAKALKNHNLTYVSGEIDKVLEGKPSVLDLDKEAAEVLGDVIWNEMLDRGMEIF
ncbi:hypothetical protein ACFYYS_06115 [Streptomyces sp. NPDC002120]|uniref:hypothetical protein n=1 Tax=Streptomyces sp. NPDC002120 TaxID=3364631 RepID=UPI003678CD8B